MYLLRLIVSRTNLIVRHSAFHFPKKNFNLKIEFIDATANELINYFQDFEEARTFAELLLLPHHHHHETKVKKSLSGSNLLKLVGSSNFQEQHVANRNMVQRTGALATSKSAIIINELTSTNNSPNNPIKYQYSFTDSMADMGGGSSHHSQADFKENIKFKKKVHKMAEGASILVMPLEFVQESRIVFVRLEAAIEMSGLLEVRVRSRFVALIIGPTARHLQLYEVGRALATCLADDVCRELFYSAKSRADILSVVDQFNRGTMVIPPSEWNPKIRIEPPAKYMSKEERKKVPELSEYIHVDEGSSSLVAHDHADPTLKGSRK